MKQQGTEHAIEGNPKKDGATHHKRKKKWRDKKNKKKWRAHKHQSVKTGAGNRIEQQQKDIAFIFIYIFKK